jgi:hypothetical protein
VAIARNREKVYCACAALSIFLRLALAINHGGFLMSPAAAAAPEAPPRTLESLLPSATDDEILGLVTLRKATPRVDDAFRSAGVSPASADGLRNAGILPAGFDSRAAAPETADTNSTSTPAAWKATFLTPRIDPTQTEAPDEIRAALLADLNRMDALFFSQRAEDHAELARSIAALDPAAFASLAQAIASLAADSPSSRAPSRATATSHATASVSAPNPATTATQQDASRRSSTAGAALPPAPAAENLAHAASASQTATTNAAPAQNPTPAQAEFFHATNAAAVEGVLEAIESQVERLLAEGVSKSARARVVGEIYRELDTTLRSNRQLTQQMRDAFRSGALDSDHQRAIVSLVTGRARQALPAVAKRVLNEWTSTIVAANNDRRTRQRTAERRIDIAGSSGRSTGATRSSSPREINYSRMSDADILNL